jgi:protein-S-isoprenylcysteine O-methyltransferase Ste14
MTTSASTPRLRITQTWYLLLLLLTGIAGTTPLSRWADMLLGALALLLVCGAFLGRIWCSAFIAGRKDQTLVTSGPYSHCRNPLYSFSWIGGLGLGLATRSMLLTALTLTVLAWLFWRAAAEEAQLLEQLHGAAYQTWRAVTPCFLPKLGSNLGQKLVPHSPTAALPAAIELRPEIFWKAFRDAGSMLLLYVLIDSARQLREIGALPTLLRLL